MPGDRLRGQRQPRRPAARRRPRHDDRGALPLLRPRRPRLRRPGARLRALLRRPREPAAAARRQQPAARAASATSTTWSAATSASIRMFLLGRAYLERPIPAAVLEAEPELVLRSDRGLHGEARDPQLPPGGRRRGSSRRSRFPFELVRGASCVAPFAERLSRGGARPRDRLRARRARALLRAGRRPPGGAGAGLTSIAEQSLRPRQPGHALGRARSPRHAAHPLRLAARRDRLPPARDRGARVRRPSTPSRASAASGSPTGCSPSRCGCPASARAAGSAATTTCARRG